MYKSLNLQSKLNR